MGVFRTLDRLMIPMVTLFLSALLIGLGYAVYVTAALASRLVSSWGLA